MLSSKSAEILQFVSDEKFDQIKDWDTYSFLYNKRKYISTAGSGIDCLTPEGEEALEDYFHYMKALEREEKTLEYARKADRRSYRANLISIISIVCSAVVSLTAIAVSVWSVLNG